MVVLKHFKRTNERLWSICRSVTVDSFKREVANEGSSPNLPYSSSSCLCLSFVLFWPVTSLSICKIVSNSPMPVVSFFTDHLNKTLKNFKCGEWNVFCFIWVGRIVLLSFPFILERNIVGDFLWQDFCCLKRVLVISGSCCHAVVIQSLRSSVFQVSWSGKT